MNDLQNNIKDVAGFAISTGICYLTGFLPVNFVTKLLGDLTSSYAVDKMKEADFKKIRNILLDTHPSDLNHDLQKLIVRSLQWSIKNIEFLYKERYPLQNHQEARLTNFTKKLLKDVKVKGKRLNAVPDKVYKEIEGAVQADSFLKRFDFDVNEIPDVNPRAPYGPFFKEQFPEMLKLCFGELLKEESNKKALIAYERAARNDMDEKLDLILSKLDDPSKQQYAGVQRDSVVEIKEALSDKNENFLPTFAQTLTEQYETISNDLAVLKNSFYVVLEKIEESYFSKNKVYILSGFAAAALLIAALAYYIYTTPFTMGINLLENNTVNIHKDYPELEKGKTPSVEFYFDNEKVVKENTSNGITLSEIPAKYKGKKIRAVLVDEYWKLTHDSIQLSKGNTTLWVEPNEKLAIITGRVFKHIGHAVVSGARVKMVSEGIETLTDANGVFNISVPVEHRRNGYEIQVTKEGIETARVMAYPEDEKEISVFETN